MKAVFDKFTEVTTPLTNKWALLPERDRLALSILSLFIFIALLFFLVWQPLLTWAGQSKESYENNRELVQWIEDNYSKFLSAKGGAGGNSSARRGRSVLSLVNQEARLQVINIKRVEPKDNNQLRVWADNVKFDALLSLIHSLEEKYAIGLVSISMEKGREAGYANSQFVLGG